MCRFRCSTRVGFCYGCKTLTLSAPCAHLLFRALWTSFRSLGTSITWGEPWFALINALPAGWICVHLISWSLASVCFQVFLHHYWRYFVIQDLCVWPVHGTINVQFHVHALILINKLALYFNPYRLFMLMSHYSYLLASSWCHLHLRLAATCCCLPLFIP